jgi:hypothetical protein
MSILKPGKDSTLPSSYRPTSLFYTVGKFFELILLTKFLQEMKERGLLRDEEFGFRPRNSTTLHLPRLIERVGRKFDDERLTGAVFMALAEAFDTV